MGRHTFFDIRQREKEKSGLGLEFQPRLAGSFPLGEEPTRK